MIWCDIFSRPPRSMPHERGTSPPLGGLGGLAYFALLLHRLEAHSYRYLDHHGHRTRLLFCYHWSIPARDLVDTVPAFACSKQNSSLFLPRTPTDGPFVCSVGGHTSCS